jgi:hypothetical protein
MALNTGSMSVGANLMMDSVDTHLLGGLFIKVVG